MRTLTRVAGRAARARAHLPFVSIFCIVSRAVVSFCLAHFAADPVCTQYTDTVQLYDNDIYFDK